MATEQPRIDPDNEPAHDQTRDPERHPQEDQAPGRILAVGTGMFLPVVIILLVAIVVILVIVL